MEPQKVLHLFKAMELKNPKVSGEYLITEKLDGWYGYVDFNAETGRFGKICSSAQRIIPSLEHVSFIALEPAAFKLGRSFRLIFEMTIPNMQFHELNGVLNRKYEAAKDVELHLHDIVVYRPNILSALERWKLLLEFEVQTHLKTVPYLGCSKEPDDWMEHFDTVTERGGEGIVLKRCTGVYTPGSRNADLLKIKNEITLDLRCVGVEESIGKKSEESLSLIVQDSFGNKQNVVVPKDSDRIAWTANPSLVIGQVVEIQAMAILPSGKLREPRFKCIRSNKKTVTDSLPHSL